MTDQYDAETGEVVQNGKISSAAMSSSAQARVQMQRDMQGYGATGLHFAVWTAMQKINVWVQTDKSGAREIKYATLKAILEAVRPALSEHGIRIRQGADRSWSADEGGGVKGRLVPVYTDLIHVPTGQMERTQIEIPISRLDAQSMGSAITYGRRYTLLAALGLTTDEADDDGSAAMPVNIDQRAADSPDLTALKLSIDKVKDLTGLHEWKVDRKNVHRWNQLADHERDRLAKHFKDKADSLMTEEPA